MGSKVLSDWGQESGVYVSYGSDLRLWGAYESPGKFCGNVDSDLVVQGWGLRFWTYVGGGLGSQENDLIPWTLSKASVKGRI